MVGYGDREPGKSAEHQDRRFADATPLRFYLRDSRRQRSKIARGMSDRQGRRQRRVNAGAAGQSLPFVATAASMSLMAHPIHRAGEAPLEPPERARAYERVSTTRRTVR